MRGANHVLDQRIGTIWVEGEVESVNRATSGHVYFCLKDARSQLKAVLWRAEAARLKFAIENGQSLLCRGRQASAPRRSPSTSSRPGWRPKGCSPRSASGRFRSCRAASGS